VLVGARSEDVTLGLCLFPSKKFALEFGVSITMRLAGRKVAASAGVSIANLDEIIVVLVAAAVRAPALADGLPASASECVIIIVRARLEAVVEQVALRLSLVVTEEGAIEVCVRVAVVLAFS